ncbi:MAG: alanine racemase [Bacteroidales bacterium]|nr:alanine racemase [Bacteroidales bacterium]
MNTTSVIELSQEAVDNNIAFIKNNLGANVKMSSVVKGNAYGHGIEYFVPMAEKAGIDHFSVYSSDEAWQVQSVCSPETDIMIMGYIDEHDRDWVIENGLEFFVFQVETLKEVIERSRKLGKKARIHLELETGMNRTGLNRRQLRQCLPLLREHADHLALKGVCTHYAGAESIANHVRVQKQITKFNRTYKWLLEQGIRPETRHTACSAAAVAYPKTQMDMVRIGILQYGFWPSKETQIHYLHKSKNKINPLMQIIRWRSRIMSLKNVRQGEFISYGTTYMALEKKRIAIVPVGYAHGFSRSLSNQGRVLIKGQRVGVIGMVNMNMLIADVTYLSRVKLGDEVVMIGQQGENKITVSSFGELSDQVNYELLTRLPSRIRRVIKK